jgi:hypothetical protein
MNACPRQPSFRLFCLLVCCAAANAQAPRLEYLPPETAVRLRSATSVSIELQRSFAAQDGRGGPGEDIAAVELPLASEVERLCAAVGLKSVTGQPDVTLRVIFRGSTHATGYQTAGKREFFYVSAGFTAMSSVLLDGREAQHSVWSHQTIPPESISDSPKPFTASSAIFPGTASPDFDSRNTGLKRVFTYPTKPQEAPFNELLPAFRQGVLTVLAGMRGVDPIVRLLATELADDAREWLKTSRSRAVEPLIKAVETGPPDVRTKALGLLQEITGQRFSSAADWHSWWEQNRATFPPGP